MCPPVPTNALMSDHRWRELKKKFKTPMLAGLLLEIISKETELKILNDEFDFYIS